MHILFNAAMRWELVPYQYNPMSLVRVKDSSKTLREPRFLTVQEFRALLEHIPEPFRASHKWMPLDRSLAGKLRQHKFRFAPQADTKDWLFANPETGKPYWPGRVQENWLVPAARKVGLGRIGWHTFRHSHSTLLHALGVDLKVQQELLRHADIRTTMNIYTQAVPKALREANSRVVRLVIPAQVA